MGLSSSVAATSYLVLISTLSFAPIAHAQQILLDASAEPKTLHGYLSHWDPDLEGMILYGDVDNPNVPGIQVFTAEGKKTSIYPLRDFPGAAQAEIWDATGGPNGDIVAATVVVYGTPGAGPVQAKSFLLTYDQTGTLTKVWDVQPYHFHRIAADAAGEVFALGDANIAGDYPLLIKYSTSGDAVGKYLPSGQFANHDSVVDLTSPNGEPQLFVINDRVYVWIAATLQLYAYSLDGNLLSVTSLSQAAHTIADLSGSSRVRFLNLQVDSSQEIIAQVGLFLRDVSHPNNRKLKGSSAIARLKPDGSFDSWLEPVSVHALVGLTAGGKPVFADKINQHAVVIRIGD